MAGISEASSIIGILAAAVQAARVLADFTIEVRDATADAKAIREDAQALFVILADLQKWLLTGAIKPAAAASLMGALNSCLLTTNQLKEVIEPYTLAIRSRSRLTWRSLKWTLNKQEVRELRERWQQSKSTLDISLNIINAYAIQTGIEKLGAQIEAGNDTLLEEVRGIQKNIVKQKENKIDAASIRGRQGSFSNKTDANFPLRRYLETLPPEGHPWARMSEPGDVISLRSISVYDPGTRSSTPETEFAVVDDAMAASPVSGRKTMIQKSHDLPDPDLRLITVTSEPTPRPEMGDLGTELHSRKHEADTNPQRSISLPHHGLEESSGIVGPSNTISSSLKSAQQINGPLHQALIDENTYKIMSLLTTDIDVNELGRENRTPLHVCALLNDKVTAQALLRTGRVDLSLRDTHDRTPLQCALEVGNDRLACLLLSNGANIEEVASFIVEMTHRMRKPAEEKVAHACLAWLSNRDDLNMQNRLVDALVASSGTSTGSIARFLEGTPYGEIYVQRSSVRIRSRSMNSRQKATHIGPPTSRGRFGVEKYFGTDVAASGVEPAARPDTLSPISIIQNSVLWRVSWSRGQVMNQRRRLLIKYAAIKPQLEVSPNGGVGSLGNVLISSRHAIGLAACNGKEVM